MSTTTMHAYTVPESLVPGHLHPNTQRKYREVLRKFQVTQGTTWPDVLAAVNAVGNINTRRTCIMVLRRVLGRAARWIIEAGGHYFSTMLLNDLDREKARQVMNEQDP